MGFLSHSIRSGSWSYSSKADPRWNISGTAEAMAASSEPREAREALDALKKKLGAEPPADLEYWCMKD